MKHLVQQHGLRNRHLENKKRKYWNFNYCFDLNLTKMLLLITKKHLRKVVFVKKTGTQAYTITYQLQAKCQKQ